MTAVTGTGCLLGAVLAAFFSAYYPCKNRLSIGEFLGYALAYYGLAGESAVQVSGVQPGSFSVALWIVYIHSMMRCLCLKIVYAL